MGNEQVKSVQTTGAMTTLGIASNGKPVTSETTSKPSLKTNFFNIPADELVKLVNNSNGKPVTLGFVNPYKQNVVLAGSQQPQIQEQVEAQVAQVSNPSVKNIVTRWGKDLLSGIRRYDKSINGGQIANKTIPPESDLYYAAASNGRIQAILYQMQQEMN